MLVDGKQDTDALAGSIGESQGAQPLLVEK